MAGRGWEEAHEDLKAADLGLVQPWRCSLEEDVAEAANRQRAAILVRRGPSATELGGRAGGDATWWPG